MNRKGGEHDVEYGSDWWLNVVEQYKRLNEGKAPKEQTNNLCKYVK